MLMYVQDYDEQFAPQVQWGTTMPGAGGATGCRAHYPWHDKVVPYIKNQQLFTCPSSPGGANLGAQAGPAAGNGWWVSSANFPNGLRCGYGYNMYLGGRPAAFPVGRAIGDVQLPAECAMFGDNAHPVHLCCTNQNMRRTSLANACSWGCPPAGQTPGDNYARHNNGSNICFADGHAKFSNWQAIEQNSQLWGDGA
jgi:prepilin-type processing-associated H-X9-DG protein